MALVDATKETFQDLIGSGLVLVDVWADSCRPCVALARTWRASPAPTLS